MIALGPDPSYFAMTPTERYVATARDAGCPRDQAEAFLRARLVLQPPQLAFAAAARSCDRPDGPTEIAYGGARGGGKSFVGIAVVADDCLRYPGLKALYLRKVGKTGREAVQDLRRQVLHSIPHEYKVQEGRIVFPNGSSIVLGHYQNEKDIDNYLGLEYDVALIEEATQLTSRKVRDIATCVRSSKPGWRPRTYYTTNPGNIGHAWFKDRFIAPWRNGVERATRFVQATVRDNRFVNAEYRATLESLTGWQRRAWLDGDWDLAAGQFFTNFRRDFHVVPAFDLPAHWPCWLGFDYGFSHYTSIHLLARGPDGVVFAVDEHAERGWLPERHVAAIRAMLARHGTEIDSLEGTFAGWDCFNRDRRGKSIADDYGALGLRLDRADADRINGAAEVLRRLGEPDANPPRRPTLLISERCPRLIECLPTLQRDPKRPEDVLKADTDDDGLGGDDPYDSMRYGLMHAAVDRRVSEGANPFGEGWR